MVNGDSIGVHGSGLEKRVSDVHRQLPDTGGDNDLTAFPLWEPLFRKCFRAFLRVITEVAAFGSIPGRLQSRRATHFGRQHDGLACGSHGQRCPVQNFLGQFNRGIQQVLGFCQAIYQADLVRTLRVDRPTSAPLFADWTPDSTSDGGADGPSEAVAFAPGLAPERDDTTLALRIASRSGAQFETSALPTPSQAPASSDEHREPAEVPLLAVAAALLVVEALSRRGSRG